MSHPPFALTVDLVVFTIRQQGLEMLAILRGDEPFAGWLALPGGFVRPDESLADAARRELTRETGLGPVEGLHLEQLGTYGNPHRDPRMWTASVAYLAFGADLPQPRAGTGAAATAWLPVDDLWAARASGRGLGADGMAFDHDRILVDGLERVRSKLEYTTLATTFCPDEFTIAELRQVYEVIWGLEIDPRNFHRKVQASPGFVEPTGKRTRGDRGRPAQTYRAGSATTLHPPMARGGPIDLRSPDGEIRLDAVAGYSSGSPSTVMSTRSL